MSTFIKKLRGAKKGNPYKIKKGSIELKKDVTQHVVQARRLISMKKKKKKTKGKERGGKKKKEDRIEKGRGEGTDSRK